MRLQPNGAHRGWRSARPRSTRPWALLSKSLQTDGVYVGEVVVTGLVKGTEFDAGNATLEASTIADKFWELLSRARRPIRDTLESFTGRLSRCQPQRLTRPRHNGTAGAPQSRVSLARFHAISCMKQARPRSC